MSIYWRGLLIEIGLDNMTGFLDIAQDALELKQKEFDDFTREAWVKIDPNDAVDLYEHYSDELWRLYGEFPNQLYSSFLISWYSFIEHELFGFCDDRKRNNNLQLKHSDLAGKGIKQAKLYLGKVVGIPLVDEHWAELTGKIGKIRNIIIHRSGKFTTEELKKLDSYIQIHNLLSPDQQIDSLRGTGLNFSVEYCRHLIKFARTFFSQLFFDAKLTNSPRGFAIRSKERAMIIEE